VKVLVVKLSSLGDVVHAMPAVQDMCAQRPGLQLDWVVERAFVPLVERCDGVGKAIACDLRRWRESPFSAQTRNQGRAFLEQLRQERYDAVLDLQGLTKSALVARLARTSASGRRFAFANRTDGSAFEVPARWLADSAIVLPQHIHAVARSRLLCARALGYTQQGPDVFGLRAATLPAPVPQRPTVALVHGTSRADKQWPRSHWVAVGRLLNRAGLRVALAHGTAAEALTSEAIAQELKDACIWPRMALDQLVDAMAGCVGVIGVDSGLSHIAVALDLPHVQIYNFDTAWRTGPAQAASGCARQVSVFAQPCPSVAMVWSAWEALPPGAPSR
jgi:heptosyltransferase-1